MKNQTIRTIAALALLAAIVLYRLCAGIAAVGHPWLYNFAPVAAVALCGGMYLPRRLAFIVPLGAMLVSDVVLNWHLGYPLVSPEMISRYFALVIAVGIGAALQNRPSLTTALPAALLSSLIFYIVTNTSSWLGSPQYAHTVTGWLQALTTGLPGYEPTWMFFRSTIISDIAFTALFVMCMSATPTREELPPGEMARAR
jgi:hypothetical protein